jgi:hypothetical protein
MVVSLGVVTGPKIDSRDSIEVRNMAANGEIFIHTSQRRLSIKLIKKPGARFNKAFSRRQDSDTQKRLGPVS